MVIFRAGGVFLNLDRLCYADVGHFGVQLHFEGAPPLTLTADQARPLIAFLDAQADRRRVEAGQLARWGFPPPGD